MNDRWSAITGIPREEACGRPWVDAVGSADRDRVLAQRWHAADLAVTGQTATFAALTGP